MTITCASSRLAGAVAAGLLFLAPSTQVNAKSSGSGRSAPAATASYGYKPPPVVRDHRKSPKPWSLPPRYHRH